MHIVNSTYIGSTHKRHKYMLAHRQAAAIRLMNESVTNKHPNGNEAAPAKSHRTRLKLLMFFCNSHEFIVLRFNVEYAV